jgi:hypothetical protein
MRTCQRCNKQFAEKEFAKDSDMCIKCENETRKIENNPIKSILPEDLDLDIGHQSNKL